MKNIKATNETIVRTVVLFLLLVNQCLAIFGKEKLPFTEEEIYQGVSTLLTIGATIWAWWKNNSFTKEAITADEYKSSLKDCEVENEEVDMI